MDADRVLGTGKAVMWIAYAAERLAGPCFYWGIAILDAIRVAALMVVGGINGEAYPGKDDRFD